MPRWAGPVASYMASGLVTTVELAAITVISSVLLGIALGSLITLPLRPVRLLVRAYIELWRGLPIILTLFFIFFTMPAIGFRLTAFTAALIGLTLWGSANMAEAVRGAVQSIPAGQRDAAWALGFTWLQAMLWVILPQATRRLLPPLLGLITNLIQASSLGAVIGIREVLESAQRMIERLTFNTGNSHGIEILGSVLVVFFVISFPLTRLSQLLERRLVV